MAIPAYLKTLGVNPRRANSLDDPDDVLTFSRQQTETQLIEQIGRDKKNAVERLVSDVEKTKLQIKENRLPDITDALNQKLKTEQARLREFCRDDILDMCKDKSGLIDRKKFDKIMNPTKII